MTGVIQRGGLESLELAGLTPTAAFGLCMKWKNGRRRSISPVELEGRRRGREGMGVGGAARKEVGEWVAGGFPEKRCETSELTTQGRR